MGSDSAQSLIEENTVAAPDSIYAEVGNVIWKRVRFGKLSAAEAERAFQEMIARRPTGARGNAARLEAQRAAFDLGWQGYLQRGRSKASNSAN